MSAKLGGPFFFVERAPDDTVPREPVFWNPFAGMVLHHVTCTVDERQTAIQRRKLQLPRIDFATIRGRL